MYSASVIEEAKGFLNATSIKARKNILIKSSKGFQKLLYHICRLYMKNQIVLSSDEERKF